MKPELDQPAAERPNWSNERDEMIFMYRQLGMPFQQIGDKFDLSRERVRQILMRRERNCRYIDVRGSSDKIRQSILADEYLNNQRWLAKDPTNSFFCCLLADLRHPPRCDVIA
jgi:hypothetical protein